MPRRWTPREDAALTSGWGVRHITDIARSLQRSESGCAQRALALGLHGGRSGLVRLRTLEKTTGYGVSRLRDAVEVLGLQLRPLPRIHPNQSGKKPHMGLDEAGLKRVLDLLAKHPDGVPLRRRGRLKGTQGVWGEAQKPERCTRCRRNDRPHHSRGRCKPCTRRDARASTGQDPSDRRRCPRTAPR
jgi:hypothetical protein